MNGTYSELRDKAVSHDLIERLIMALTDVAITVYMNAGETEQHKKYAVQVARSPRGIAEQMKFAVVFLATDDSDAQLKNAAHAVFNVFASEVQVEPTI